jgi:hypothetical protein
MENTHVGRAKRGELTMHSPKGGSLFFRFFRTFLINKREFCIIIGRLFSRNFEV